MTENRDAAQLRMVAALMRRDATSPLPADAAEAVAVLLEYEARLFDLYAEHWAEPDCPPDLWLEPDMALAVARAYLGERHDRRPVPTATEALDEYCEACGGPCRDES